MRGRIIGWAIAGALSWLAGTAAAAPTPTPTGGTRGQLEAELVQIDNRIVEAQEMLDRIDAGGAFLATDGLAIVVMTRDQLTEAATEMIYREGLGLGGARPHDEVLRRVQQIVSASPRLVEGMRQLLKNDKSRRDVIDRELARLRAKDNAAVQSAAVASSCSLPHSWRIDVTGRGSSNVAVDASGTVSGGGITSGRATLAGSQLTIQWFSQGGGYEVGGRYLVTLDRACNGAGELVLDVLPDGAGDLGIRGGPVTLTSLGKAGPS